MAPRKFCKRKITLEGITVDVPGRDGITQFLTKSGTFTDGDIRLNEHGLQIVSNVQPTNEKDDQTTLQDFETVKVVGRGASAVVQLVCHKWTGQLFAMKVIPLNIEEAIIKQVLDELKIIHSFTCPYIVQFYDAFYHNGSVSILLEYMDSGTLGDLLKKKKTIPEPQLAVICKQVLQGLILLHKQHIIHRDIKPSNLLLNSKGNVKIADFGVSAVLANTLQQRDTFVGTFTYMAPERIVGSKYGYLSDIWSLGITILECALGHLPYLSLGEVVPDSVYELLQMIVERPPPTAPSDQFSDEFCSFISACVQKDPESRTPASVLLEHAFIKKYGNLDEASEGTFLEDVLSQGRSYVSFVLFMGPLEGG